MMGLEPEPDSEVRLTLCKGVLTHAEVVVWLKRCLGCESSSKIFLAAEWLDQVGSGSGKAWREDARLRTARRGPTRVGSGLFEVLNHLHFTICRRRLARI
jgi:hypothetical protein